MDQNVYSKMCRAWECFVRTEYTSAKQILLPIVIEPTDFVDPDVGACYFFFKFMETQISLSSLVKSDPFRKVYHFFDDVPSERKAALKQWLNNCNPPTPIYDGGFSKPELSKLLEIIQSDSPTENHRLALLLSAISTCRRLGAYKEALDCLEFSREMVLTQPIIEFTLTLYRIYDSIRSIDIPTEPIRKSLLDKQPCADLIEYLRFEFEASRTTASWLESNSSFERIPGNFETDSANWRWSAVKSGLLLLQAYASSREFSKGSAIVDCIIELLHLPISSMVNHFCWNAKSTWYPISPIDKNVDEDIRRFILWEYIRIHRIILPSEHETMVMLSKEYSSMIGDDLQSIQSQSKIRLPREEIFDPSKVLESVSKMNVHSKDGVRALSDYIKLHWSIPNSEVTDEIYLGYTVIGDRHLQCRGIGKPADYTSTLTPQKVAALIDVVNSASGKFFFGSRGGYSFATLVLNRADSG